jgi:hypothetical protein
MPLSWQDRLDSAATESEVISIARDFIAQFTPQEIERLPKACRPGKFFEANDVTSHAFALIRYECGKQDEAAAVLRRLASFFSNASIRLSQIMAHPNVEPDESRESA